MLLIEVNEKCSSNSTNMMIGGILSMISQVIKRGVTENASTRMNREIKLVYLIWMLFLHLCKQNIYLGLDHIIISYY